MNTAEAATQRNWHRDGMAVDLAVYENSRIKSVGECCFPLLEYGLGIDLTGHPAAEELRRLNHLVARHWIDVNDIFPYRKELYSGDTVNGITPADNGGDLQVAVDRIAATVLRTETNLAHGPSACCTRWSNRTRQWPVRGSLAVDDRREPGMVLDHPPLQRPRPHLGRPARRQRDLHPPTPPSTGPPQPVKATPPAKDNRHDHQVVGDPAHAHRPKHSAAAELSDVLRGQSIA
ncbi:terpene synthase family protein [Streptomyces sp. AHA2]|uniref:terpene synthase family protein n=1 Tax=Streptomyces sp. AHA2 TaxID=3064526 RepID=UPI002FDFDEE9